jgi:hypothetical protein
MTLLAAGGMLITASSQSLTMMIIGTALTGLFSVVAQILVPLAATLASPEKRGKVVGTIMMTLQSLRGRETRTEQRRIDSVGLALLILGIGSLQGCSTRVKSWTGSTHGRSSS